MPKIEVLVATMYQNDLSKFVEMNLKSDTYFANQTDKYEYIESNIEGNRVRMLSTDDRGVGKNRNLALLFSEGEICLLGDDDVKYVDDYENIIKEAFECLPDADMIIFNIETLGRNVNRRKNTKIKRIRLHNFLNYGAVRFAFKRESIIRNNIWFSLKFGGGCLYGAGEDSLFLRESLKKGLKLYTYPVKIASVKQEASTWFTGYNEKYFFDKGAFLSAAFPLLKYIFALYYSIKFRKHTNLTIIQILNYLLSGMSSYKKGIGYQNE